MSVNCKAVIGPFTHDANCECTLVDFYVNVTGLCNHTRYGFVARVLYGGDVVATVCRIFDVNVAGDECSCVNVRQDFINIITEVECCNDDTLTWDIDFPCHNYIIGCCSEVE